MILGQQNHATPLAQGSAHSSRSYVSCGLCFLAHDPSSLSTSAFCWLGQSKVTQLPQDCSGQIKKINILLTLLLRAVTYLPSGASYEDSFSWILNVHTGTHEDFCKKKKFKYTELYIFSLTGSAEKVAFYL